MYILKVAVADYTNFKAVVGTRGRIRIEQVSCKTPLAGMVSVKAGRGVCGGGDINAGGECDNGNFRWPFFDVQNREEHS